MADFLLELLSEEIPARMQAKAESDLKRLLTAKLDEAGLGYDAAETYSTPRRLILHVTGLPTAQPDVKEERRGPNIQAHDKAIEGFLKSAGVTREQVVEREEKKGTFLYAVIEKNGRKTADVLARAIPDIISSFPWPKSMRWGDGDTRWVRPLKSILSLFDSECVPGWLFDVVVQPHRPKDEITGGHEEIAFSNKTSGHPFHAPESFAVTNFTDYKAKLEASKVLIDPAERRAVILKEAQALALVSKLALNEDAALLAEVAGLVEWPVTLMGSFDPAYLAVPEEVIIATIRKNQKCFTLRDPKTGRLANCFITVANIEAEDGGKAIIAGNEKVIAARLSDAKFFWDQDLKVKLEDRLPALKDIVFHEKLGTVGDRVERIEKLAARIAEQYIPDADVVKTSLAAKLCKADLVSGMVGEFPELQGLMGSYYALEQGENMEVAHAIRDHYAPKGPDDICPTEPVSVALALAEKIDTLVGFFGIDEKPTGSKDPFALRRAALGVIRLITENGLQIPLNNLLPQDISDDLLSFFADRLKVQQKEKGTRHDLIDAVFSLGGEDDLVRLLARVEALQAFLGTDDGANLLTAYRRAANIVRIEEKKHGASYDGVPDEKLFAAKEEKKLAKKLGEARAAFDKAIAAEEFEKAMAAIAALRGPVDAFFDNVTVNTDDEALRQNRLKLLAQIRGSLDAVADFSKVEG